MGSNIVGQIYKNGGLNNFNCSSLVIDTVSGAVGGLAGGAGSGNYFRTSSQALTKRISNAVTYNIGKSASKEIKKATTNFIKNTSTNIINQLAKNITRAAVASTVSSVLTSYYRDRYFYIGR